MKSLKQQLQTAYNDRFHGVAMRALQVGSFRRRFKQQEKRREDQRQDKADGQVGRQEAEGQEAAQEAHLASEHR